MIPLLKQSWSGHYTIPKVIFEKGNTISGCDIVVNAGILSVIESLNLHFFFTLMRKVLVLLRPADKFFKVVMQF